MLGIKWNVHVYTKSQFPSPPYGGEKWDQVQFLFGMHEISRYWRKSFVECPPHWVRKGLRGQFPKKWGIKWIVHICTENHVSKPHPHGSDGGVEMSTFSLLGTAIFADLHRNIMYGTPPPWCKVGFKFQNKCLLLGIIWNIWMCTKKSCFEPLSPWQLG